MNDLNRLLALVLALILACALCSGAAAEADEAAGERAEGTLVYAAAAFGQKFSPFFLTTTYDRTVVDQVHITLLAEDRGGAEINDGIGGETVKYNGVAYEYSGAGSVEVVQNDDGSADYNLTMRDDIVFSDGVPATIDDVIFGIYVESDPTYDGQFATCELPIEGMEEYRSGMDSRGSKIFADGEGEGYVENDLYTEAQYDAFWTYYHEESGAAFAQEIVDFCVANGYNAPDDSVTACAAKWGYDLDANATTYDFWKAIADAYDTEEEAEAAESAGSTRMQLTIANLGAEYEVGVETGESAPNIAGIVRTGDYSMTIHMTRFNAMSIYDLDFWVAPMHYYGDPELYDYGNNRFGFRKGDLTGVRARNAEPLGAGPYTFEGCADGVVTLKANEKYYKGKPGVPVLLMQEAAEDDYVRGIVEGRFDIAAPSIDDRVVKAIKKANSNGELQGDVIHTVLVDYRGYGYIGINADLVNVGGKPASDASKALRKGFMTLFAVYRDTAIADYYGDRASVIQYPISNTSWAAPRPADVGYRVAYSVDVDGKPIYSAAMSDEERYEAAKAAAIGYFRAAGFTYDEKKGKFTDATDTYEIMIRGESAKDHPAYGVATAASKALAGLGIKLKVNGVGTSVWNNALESNTAMMWAAAWQASVDPDMTQVYASENAHGNGTNSNHYAVDDAELDALIREGRESADTGRRTRIYKDAMDIIMDWGCELPLYQRKECVLFSAERVDLDTIPQDMTPFWEWYSEIETLAVK